MTKTLFKSTTFFLLLLLVAASLFATVANAQGSGEEGDSPEVPPPQNPSETMEIPVVGEPTDEPSPIPTLPSLPPRSSAPSGTETLTLTSPPSPPLPTSTAAPTTTTVVRPPPAATTTTTRTGAAGSLKAEWVWQGMMVALSAVAFAMTFA
ncbi:hypothetical protein DFQ26_004522 [Actinomortierella ambigua]|nr:hypothetical protein DFQ26_004522 [Actinomortierella ambigua]